MTTRATIEQLVEVMNRHDAQAATELLAEDVLFWEPTYDEPLQGREAIRRELEGFFAMLPDIRFTVETVLANGDQALCEWIYRATYNGRPIEIRECGLSRLNADGQIVEVRMYFDRLTLLRQLGFMPEA